MLCGVVLLLLGVRRAEAHAVSRNSRGSGKNTFSVAVVTVSIVTSKRAREGVDDLVDQHFRRGRAGRDRRRIRTPS